MDSPDYKEKMPYGATLPNDFRPLMEKLPIGILIHAGGIIRYVNQALVNMLHTSAAKLVGRAAADLFSGKNKQFLYQSPTEDSPTAQVATETEMVVGTTPPLLVEVSHSQMVWDGHKIHTLAIKDITENRQEKEHIRRLASLDTLTGLPNRALFMDRLNQELIRSKRSKSHVALLFIDLDRFKWVNDTLGHSAGDALLQEAAQRLLACHRKSDTVARLGGDEFTVILPDIARGPFAERVCRNILDRLAEPFFLEGQEVFISGSIGITIFPDDADNLQDLLKNADTAMYRAKAEGRNTFRFFTREMHAQAVERVSLEKDLHSAVEKNLLSVQYQAILDLKTKRVVGAEAFLRWDHPQRGMVPPNTFIPLAEEIGLSTAITEWTLNTVCHQAAQWRLLPGMEEFFISINITCYRCRDLTQGSKIREIVAKSGLPPHYLTLEITENILSENEPVALEMLTDLRQFGVTLWLDDFGTGQSSLRVLKTLPLCGIKIDRMFIHDIISKPESAILVEIVLGLARSLDLRVVGEGVETVAQQDFLAQRGCDLVQGFLYSKPLSPDMFAAYVRQSVGENLVGELD